MLKCHNSIKKVYFDRKKKNKLKMNRKMKESIEMSTNNFKL